MSLSLFWPIKINPDDEQPRILHQPKDDDVIFPVIPPTTNLVLKLLHPGEHCIELFLVGYNFRPHEKCARICFNGLLSIQSK